MTYMDPTEGAGTKGDGENATGVHFDARVGLGLAHCLQHNQDESRTTTMYPGQHKLVDCRLYSH